jgi:hypothetical protein
MRFRRFLLLFLLPALALGLSGCIYLRLLEVKYHLQTFDGYVAIKNRGGLSLIFLKPVLLKGDLLVLARRHPTKTEESLHETRWQYLFLKQLPGCEGKGGAFDVPVDLLFQNNRLSTVTFPERFYENLPESFIIAALKALGRSEINVKARSAHSAVSSQDVLQPLDIPRKQDMLRLLGKPSKKKEEDTLLVLTYRYRLEQGEGDEKKGPAYGWTKLTFRAASGALLKAEARFAMVRLSMDFSDQATDHHPATVALLP